MNALPLESRTQNVTGRDRCRWCADEGQVVVQIRSGGYEETGPCPYCEKGFAVEFPTSKTGPWGAEGYWHGRVHADLEPLQPVLPIFRPVSDEA